VFGVEGDGSTTNKEGQAFETFLVPFLGAGRGGRAFARKISKFKRKAQCAKNVANFSFDGVSQARSYADGAAGYGWGRPRVCRRDKA
jgi:hypothetical protein